MRNSLFFTLTVLFLVNSFGESKNFRNKDVKHHNSLRNNLGEKKKEKDSINYYGERRQEIKDDEEVFDPDEFIERPCPVYDRFCIRGYFAKHSKCSIAPGPVPDPFYLTQVEVYLSRINLTGTANDNSFFGLPSGRIVNFYVNKKTDNLVLAVYFPFLSVFANETTFRFARNGAEPVERTTFIEQTYPGLTVTTVIPNLKDLKIEDSAISGYLDDGTPPFVIGPELLNDPNPTVVATLKALLEDIPSNLREVLLTAVPVIGKIWIQYNICDFSVPINKIGYYN